MELTVICISGFLFSAVSDTFNLPLLSGLFKAYLLPASSYWFGVETLPPASGQHMLPFFINPIVPLWNNRLLSLPECNSLSEVPVVKYPETVFFFVFSSLMFVVFS